MKSALALMALGAAALPVAAVAQTSVTIAETAPIVTLNVTESVEAAPDVATVGTGRPVPRHDRAGRHAG